MARPRELFLFWVLTIGIVCGHVPDHMNVLKGEIHPSGSPGSYESTTISTAGTNPQPSGNAHNRNLADERLTEDLLRSKIMRKISYCAALSRNMSEADYVSDFEFGFQRIKRAKDKKKTAPTESPLKFCYLKICPLHSRK